MDIPEVKPVKFKEFDVKQSKYEMVGKLPTRAIIVGPSGSGKTVLLQSMILDIYRGCFSRIYMPKLIVVFLFEDFAITHVFKKNQLVVNSLNFYILTIPCGFNIELNYLSVRVMCR